MGKIRFQMSLSGVQEYDHFAGEERAGFVVEWLSVFCVYFSQSWYVILAFPGHTHLFLNSQTLSLVSHLYVSTLAAALTI